MLVISALVLGFATFGCKKRRDKSNLEGHFEATNKNAAPIKSERPTVVPEYERSQAIIVTSDVLYQGHIKETGPQLLKEILSAHAKIYMIMKHNEKPIGIQMDLRNMDFNDDEIDSFHFIESRYSKSDSLVIWARDFAPLFGRTQKGDLRMLDFNYYEDRQSSDAVPGKIREFLKNQNIAAERISIPLYLEGGNFMSAGNGKCFITDRVTEMNSTARFADDKVYNENEIKNLLSDYAGCVETEVFPRMPFEGTGHIDMWAKFLDPETVLVARYWDRSLALAYKQSREFGDKVKVIQAYLDARALQLKKLGYNVVRIPSPLPGENKDAGNTKDLRIKSFTNALLVNGTAIVPDYSQSNSIDDGLLKEYKNEVKLGFESAGPKRHTSWKVGFVGVDQLIFDGGAIHCITMQVPTNTKRDITESCV